jgi:hypothetical protein
MDSTHFCSVRDSIHIDVLDLVVLPGSNIICPGDSVTLNGTYLGPTGLFFPTQCGPTDSCCGPRHTYIIGDTCDSNIPGGSQACQQSGFQSTAYRASFEASRIQYVFQESELQTAGFLGGTIESLTFHLSWLLVQGGNSEIDEMVIKMGCTLADSLSEFVDGLTTVWGPAPFQPQLGFNTHVLDLAYDWTGAENLVIQICTTDSTNPSGIAFYETSANTYSFPPTIKADRFTPQAPCELLPDTGRIYERPTVRFGVCVEGLDPVYTWSPATGLSNPHIPNPKASPAANTTYMLNVSVADSCICQLEKPASVTVNGCILDQAIQAFEVKKVENAAHLSWQIDPVIAISSLWIEKLKAGDFVPLVVGSGQSEAIAWDRNLTQGEHVYRLHLQDSDGQSVYSQVKSIFIAEEDLQSRVFPNPVKKGMPIFFHRGDRLPGITAYHMTGSLVYQDKYFQGNTFLTDKLPSGVYLIQVGSEVFKIVILD